MALQTDYLVKGCAASAMAFVDMMPKDTDATFTMVDKRAAPGGHWNDACHGVASRALGHGRKDSTEFNQGLFELASGCEVTDYFHQWMRDTFLPSGRVRFMPMSPVPGGPGTGRHAVRSLLSGPEEPVQVRRRLVDDTLLHTSIPLTHTRKFSVAGGVACVPPNDLARLAPGHTSFSVLGAGKTAIDSVSWLLANGAPPDSISWVLPREPWLLNRLGMQPGLDFFDQAIGAVARQLETFASAGSVHELCERMEEAGTWLRLDPTVWPTMFHGATVTSLELQQLRGIKNRVRLGRVLHLAADRMVLERGQVPVRPGTLFVDCTARALQVLPPGGVLPPVLNDGVVRLHMVRTYQPTFSAALIGHVEACAADDAVKRQWCQPVPMADTVVDYLRAMATSMPNQGAWGADPELRAWIRWCRLDMFGQTMAQVAEDDAPPRDVLARMAAAAGPAVQNLLRLTDAPH